MPIWPKILINCKVLSAEYTNDPNFCSLLTQHIGAFTALPLYTSFHPVFGPINHCAWWAHWPIQFHNAFRRTTHITVRTRSHLFICFGSDVTTKVQNCPPLCNGNGYTDWLLPSRFASVLPAIPHSSPPNRIEEFQRETKTVMPQLLLLHHPSTVTTCSIMNFRRLRPQISSLKSVTVLQPAVQFPGARAGIFWGRCSIKCMANPRRVKMVAKQIRRELSDMLLTDKVLQYAILPEAALGADRYLSSLTTISDVEVSADLQVRFWLFNFSICALL